jgi:hypothetical protein
MKTATRVWVMVILYVYIASTVALDLFIWRPN